LPSSQSPFSGRIGLSANATRRNARTLPPSVPLGTSGNAFDWGWGKSPPDGKQAIELHAKTTTQSEDNNRMDLRSVELQIYTKDGSHYERARSPIAVMTVLDKKLYNRR
jgi:hypothetical protein